MMPKTVRQEWEASVRAMRIEDVRFIYNLSKYELARRKGQGVT